MVGQWFLAATLQLANFSVGLTQQDFLTDSAWLEYGAKAAPGETLDIGRIADLEVDATRRLKALGYHPQGRHKFVKEVELASAAPLVHRVGAGLSSIDAVAVMSIDRTPAERPYLYDTLTSLLHELPDGTVINVVIGDERDGYVTRPRLEELFGEAQAARIHVITTPKTPAAYLAANYDIKARASWNYARILRGFRGKNHLLVLEDDVQLSRGMVPALNELLGDEHPPLVSLYNYHCGRLPGADATRLFDVRILSYPARAIDRGFGRSQAIVYTRELAHQLGNYLSLRLGNDPFDVMIGQYLRVFDLALGYVQPSMVQHVGFVTSGLGPFHESVCYSPVYPQL